VARFRVLSRDPVVVHDIGDARPEHERALVEWLAKRPGETAA
jgi:hypothetical protein